MNEKNDRFKHHLMLIDSEIVAKFDFFFLPNIASSENPTGPMSPVIPLHLNNPNYKMSPQ